MFYSTGNIRKRKKFTSAYQLLEYCITLTEQPKTTNLLPIFVMDWGYQARYYIIICSSVKKIPCNF